MSCVKLPAVPGASTDGQVVDDGTGSAELGERQDAGVSELPYVEGKKLERSRSGMGGSRTGATTPSLSFSPGPEGEETAAPVRAEEYVFSGFPPPLDVHPDELLLHTAQLIVVPRKTGYSAFRRFLVEGNPTALDVVEHCFWYLHCKFFHPETTQAQQKQLLVRPCH